MGAPYSKDLRIRLVEAYRSGMSRRGAAKRYNVAPSTAIRWIREAEETGRVEARPSGGDRHSWRIEAHSDFLLQLVRDEPAITLEETRSRLLDEREFNISISAISRFFKRHGLSFKKKRCTPPSKIVTMCASAARNGSKTSRTLTPNGSSSSTKPA